MTELVAVTEKWKEGIPAQMGKSMLENYRKQHRELKEKITDIKEMIGKEKYSEYYSSIEDIEVELPKLPIEMSLRQLKQAIDALQRSDKEITTIFGNFTSTKSSVEMILQGFERNAGKETLATYLNARDLTAEKIVTDLHKVAQLSNEEQLVKALGLMKFRTLTPAAAAGIKTFIEDKSNTKFIREKIACYEQVQSLEDNDRYMPLIDKADFRHTVDFLNKKGMASKEAIVLAIADHCSEEVTAE
ncbi:MAG: hypothetical protein ACRCXC_11645 [Legionella sp.]